MGFIMCRFPFSMAAISPPTVLHQSVTVITRSHIAKGIWNIYAALDKA